MFIQEKAPTRNSTEEPILYDVVPANKACVCFLKCTSSSSSSSTPLYCLRENISFDTLIRRSSRGHNSRKATQPSHCGTCLILLIFIAKRVQPSLPSSTLRSNFVYIVYPDKRETHHKNLLSDQPSRSRKRGIDVDGPPCGLISRHFQHPSLTI